jgi:hypothetical protein
MPKAGGLHVCYTRIKVNGIMFGLSAFDQDDAAFLQCRTKDLFDHALEALERVGIYRQRQYEIKLLFIPILLKSHAMEVTVRDLRVSFDQVRDLHESLRVLDTIDAPGLLCDMK